VSDFEITEVSEEEPKSWTGDHGTFLIYEIQAKGGQGEGYFDVKRKASSPAPTVGETIDAEIVRKGDRKPELKRIRKQDGASSSSPARGNWSPEKERSIVRQHSQKVAVMWLTLMQARGKIPEDADKDFLIKYIDFFQNDAEGKLT
jgi:hypothetical protein